MLHVVVISWQGQRERARQIAEVLGTMPDTRVSVIYSNTSETAESGAGQWIQVPNDHFFGSKFKRALDCVTTDATAMVIIQADASTEDWSVLLERCREQFDKMPRLGLWAPRVTYTPWTPERVDIRPVADTELMHVAQTDGIVLAFGRPVIERLRRLDYKRNNMGWGIDCIAICFCYANALMVVRDDHLIVHHPKGRGYDTRLATRQWHAFMQQLCEPEQCIHAFIQRFTERKRRSLLGRLSDEWRALRRNLTRFRFFIARRTEGTSSSTSND